MTKKDKIWIGAVVLLLVLDAIYMVMIGTGLLSFGLLVRPFSSI